MSTNEQPVTAETSTDQPASVPISVRDVLRAVFMPPQGDEPPVHLTASTVGKARRRAVRRENVMVAPEIPPVPPAVTYVEQPITPLAGVSPLRLTTVVIGGVTVILIAYMAQTAVAGGKGSGWLLYALAVLVWLGLLLFEFAPPDGGLLRRGPHITGSIGYALPEVMLPPLSMRAVALMLAIPLSVATYILTADNTFTLAGVITWVLSVILWLTAAAEREPGQQLADVRRPLPRIKESCRAALKSRLLPLVAFLLIMGVAAFFRFYRLEEVPNEMTSDHVEKLLDAFDVSRGIYHVFFTRNGGREAIQFYLVALAAKVFGTGMSFLTLKLVSALEGLALIPLIILFGREMVDRETGLFAGMLVAVSWWHVVLARLALRIVLTPLVFTLLLIALVRGIRTGSRRAWLWAGIWMGIGVYAYQALRLTPLVTIAAFLISVAGPTFRAFRAHTQGHADAPVRRAEAASAIGRQALNLLLAGLVALAIFIPMLRVWHDYPAQLWNRVINRTTEAERQIEGEPLGVFIDNYRRALGMFNVRGDIAWISAVPGEPVLDVVTGGLLILGLIAWMVRLFVRRDPADAFILVAGLIMLLPSALAIAFPIENPSTTRASSTIPIVYLLAAWPLALIGQRWRSMLGHVSGMVLPGLLSVLLLAVAAQMNYTAYFVRYEYSYRHAALNPGEVAAAVRDVIGPDASLDGVWLQGWPYWHDYRAIGIEAGDITFNHAILDVPTLESYLRDFPQNFAVRPLVFIVHPSDTEALAVLRTYFPDGRLDFHRSATEGRDFYLYVVPPD